MTLTPFVAQAAAGGDANPIISLLPLVLIFVIFWFLLIRPQQKKMKLHKAMVEALRRGDKVITAGGIMGTVTKVVSDSEVQLEIADNVKIRVVRHTIQEVLSKPEAASQSGGKAPSAPANDPGASKGKGGLLGGLLGGGKAEK